MAKKIKKLTNTEIRFYKNQRKEANENSLDFMKEGLKRLGLKPIYLDDGLVMEIFEVVNKYKDRIDPSKIMSKSLWSKEKVFDSVGKSDTNKNSVDKEKKRKSTQTLSRST